MTSIILQGVPAGSHLGVDLHTWQTGPNFRGIRGIAEGIHCLHLTIHGISTTKYAVWLDAQPDKTLSYQWDQRSASLSKSKVETSPDKIEALFFVTYPAESDHAWTALTAHITAQQLANVVPLESVLTSTTSANTDDEAATLSAPALEDEPTMQFLPIDLKKSWSKGATGRELTEMSLDKSWLLGDVLQRIGGEDALLGQFEVCFLCVLLFTSISAFDQWHVIFRLFCSARKALSSHANLYTAFLASLQAQMQQVPADLFSDIFALTVPRHLRILRQTIDEMKHESSSSISSSIVENLEILVDTLDREFGADDEYAHQQAIYPVDEADHVVPHDSDDIDDEAPTIVELS